MGNWVEVWAEDVSKTGFTVVGRFHNNGSTWDAGDGLDFSLWVDSEKIYTHNEYIYQSNCKNVTISKWYDCGTSSSDRSFTIWMQWDDHGEFNFVDSWQAKTTVYVSASVYSAKAPTNVTAAIDTNTEQNKGLTVNVTWEHEGNSSAYPLQGFSVSKDKFATSLEVGPSARSATISNLDLNKAYTFEVRANGSVGNSSRVSSNVVYTIPEAPTNVTASILSLSDTAYNCSIKFDNIAINPTDKIDVQYSTTSTTWYGPGGSTSAVYSLNGVQACEINDASATVLDTTLKNILKTKRTQAVNGQTQSSLYFRVRAYNSGNPIPGPWSNSSKFSANVNLITKMYVRIPDDKKLKNVYFYTPNAAKIPKVNFKI